MTKYRKTREELETELIEQIAGLRASAEAYDQDPANNWEAKRLSSSVYILAHEGTGRTKSLLGLTGKKRRMHFLTSKVVPSSRGGRVIAATGTLIVMTRVSGTDAEYIPFLGDHPFADQFKWLSFGDWWEECVFHPLSSVKLTRKNIVFSMRVQDGGGHVDDAITDTGYANFRNSGDPAVRHSNGILQIGSDGDVEGMPVKNGARATMRQIAWEMDESLKYIGL